MTMRQESGTHAEGNPPPSSSGSPPWMELMLSVECRAPDGTTGMSVLRAASLGMELRFEALEHRVHVANGAIAQKRHRAVSDAPMGLDLRPPHAAVADADPVHVQRLGNDDVIDARRREPAALGQIMHAAVTAGFLVHGTRDLERARQRAARIDQSLDGDDRGRQSALHVAGAAAEELAVLDHARERIHRPARARSAPRRYGR